MSARARATAACAAAALLALGASAVHRAGPTQRTDLPVYLAASSEALAGRDPFGASGPRGWPYHYPPTLAVLLAPLTALPVQVAAALWFALGVAGLGVGVWSTRAAMQVEPRPPAEQGAGGASLAAEPAGPPIEGAGGASLAAEAAGPPIEGAGGAPTWDRWDALALALIAIPTASALTRGQLGPLLLGLFGLGLLALARGRDGAAGCAWALAAALKVTPGLPLVALLVARRWRALGAACVASLALLVIMPAPLIGVSSAWASCEKVARVVVLGSASGEAALDLPGARRFDPHIPTNQALGSQVVRRGPDGARAALLGLLVLAGLAATVPLAARGARPPSSASAALLLALPLVVSTVAWHHHHVLLYPALLLLATRARAGDRGSRLALAAFALAQLIHFGGAELEHLLRRVSGEPRAFSVVQSAGPLGWGTLVVIALLARAAWSAQGGSPASAVTARGA